MKNFIAVVVLLFASIGHAGLALAEEGQSSKQSAPPMHETVELKDLLDAVARKSGSEFLIDRRVPADVVTGTVKLRDIDYAMFLTVLRNNGLAAVPADNAIRVIPVNSVRQYKLPILQDSDDSIPGDAWVTRVFKLENTNAVRLVPLLRPMIQQAGHLVADSESNKLIVVAPYGVTEQLVEIVDEVDTPAGSP